MKELTYIEVGAELKVHPLHVRRIVKKYPRLIQPIVHGYNRVAFRFDQVKRVKLARERDGAKSLNHVRKLRHATAR